VTITLPRREGIAGIVFTMTIENASLLTQPASPVNDWFIIYGLPIIVALMG